VVNLPKLVKKRLQDVLLEEGLVPPNHLNEALSRQKTTGEPLPVVLTKMGVVSEAELARAFCKQFNLPYVDAGRYSIPKEVLELVSVDEMTRNHFVALDKIGKVLLIAVSEMPALEILENMEKSTGCTLFVYVSTPSQVSTAIKKCFPNGQPAAPAGGASPPTKSAPAVPAPAGGTQAKPKS